MSNQQPHAHATVTHEDGKTAITCDCGHTIQDPEQDTYTTWREHIKQVLA